jgi:UDP:flavonoid glycosyltransferase YjiC (YdhE family)
MRGRGFDASPIAAEVESLLMDDWRARTPPGAQTRAVRTLCARAPHQARDLLAAADEVQPDALLVDLLAWGAVSAAEARGGPWACYCPFPLPLPSQSGPPLGPGFRPARGPFGRLRDGLLASLANAGMNRLAGPRLEALRAELDLPPLAEAMEIFSCAPLHLCLTAPPLEYPRPDWPESVVMVGPCPWEPSGELPTELNRLETPLVLVTTSSEFQNDGRLVRVALEALADEPLHVVATMPAASSDGMAVPANATVFDHTPHTPVLARAICAITHGGMGATQKALALGVPVCAVPFGRDQPEVARRVEVAGAGTRLPAWRLNPRRLRAKVREAISRRAGAELVAEGFRQAGGAKAAADEVERRLFGIEPRRG